MSLIKAAVLTISDRCYYEKFQDKSGTAICQFLNGKNYQIVKHDIVSDDINGIQDAIKHSSDDLKVDLLITTGGTGLTARDVTPEATKTLLDKEANGISTALITGSLNITPMAMLSRLVCGIRGSTLIINFPGSQKACNECLQIIEPILEHAIDQLRNDKIKIGEVHQLIQGQRTSNVKLQNVALRPRESQFLMISIDDAMKIIVSQIDKTKNTEIIQLKDYNKLTGRIIADDVQAQVPLPPFRASIKDGYAVLAEDGCGVRKVILKANTAGLYHHDLLVTKGFCVRVSTGAPVPNGANAVVQVEDTKLIKQTQDGEEDEISIEKAPSLGQDIRPIGCDISVHGKPIVKKGTELGPIELGLIATVGVKEVEVYKKPIVSVLSTGDEILDPNQPLRPGCVWDSNRTTLLSLLHQERIECYNLGISRDEPNELYNKLTEGFLRSDVIITTGGVSMGEKDLLKQVLVEDFNATIHFGRINLKPGKPTTFSTCIFNREKKFVFGLPGNPVSAFVTCQLFVLPTLRLLAGGLKPNEENLLAFHKVIQVKLKLEKESRKLDPRPEFVRAIVSYGDDVPSAFITGNQQSSRLLSVKDANALVLLNQSSETIKEIKNNEIVKAILL